MAVSNIIYRAKRELRSMLSFSQKFHLESHAVDWSSNKSLPPCWDGSVVNAKTESTSSMALRCARLIILSIGDAQPLLRHPVSRRESPGVSFLGKYDLCFENVERGLDCADR